MSCSVCAGYSSYNCPCCSGERLSVCPDCGGTGYRGFFAFDIIDRREVKVDESTYDMLPDDEDTASSMGWRFCRIELEPCSTCGGDGEV